MRGNLDALVEDLDAMKVSMMEKFDILFRRINAMRETKYTKSVKRHLLRCASRRLVSGYEKIAGKRKAKLQRLRNNFRRAAFDSFQPRSEYGFQTQSFHPQFGFRSFCSQPETKSQFGYNSTSFSENNSSETSNHRKDGFVPINRERKKSTSKVTFIDVDVYEDLPFIEQSQRFTYFQSDVYRRTPNGKKWERCHWKNTKVRRSHYARYPKKK